MTNRSQMKDYQRTIWHYFLIVGAVMTFASIAGIVTTFIYHSNPPHVALLWGEITGATIWIDLLALFFPALCRVGEQRNNPDS